MQNISKTIILLLIYLVLPSKVFATPQPKQQNIDSSKVVKALNETLLTHYVYLEKAQQVELALNKQVQAETFNEMTEKAELAKSLTEHVQTVLNDKHFRVIVARENRSQENNDILQTHLNALTRFRKGGFQDIKMLEGNVGYVKIDGFRGEESHQVDGLMTYLRTADAIIIDLRNNGGGGQPVNYLSSYFLPEGTLIGKTYHRSKDNWKEHTVEPIKGDKRLHVPLLILTSDFTFSAAEAFSYNLQAQGRATIVGEQTGGGAHPISFLPLPEGLAVIVPNRRSYNPITKTNWEGTGVTPDHLTSEEEALDKAHELAQIAAKQYREEEFTKLSKLLNSEDESIDVLQPKVNAIIKELLHRKHIEKFMVEGFANRFEQQGNAIAAKLLKQAHQTVIAKQQNDSIASTAALTSD